MAEQNITYQEVNEFVRRELRKHGKFLVDEFKANLQKRLNRAIGQLGGVKAMLDDNRYCGDVLLQLSAAEKAVHRVSELVLENHLHTCVVEQIREGNEDVVDEAMDLIRKFGSR